MYYLNELTILKRISISFFSCRRAFRGYTVAYFNRGYFSSPSSFIIGVGFIRLRRCLSKRTLRSKNATYNYLIKILISLTSLSRISKRASSKEGADIKRRASLLNP